MQALKLTATGADISIEGMKATIVSDLIKDRTVSVILKPQDADEEIRLFGDVVYSMPSAVKSGYFDIVLKFVFVNDEVRKQLTDFVSGVRKKSEGEETSFDDFDIAKFLAANKPKKETRLSSFLGYLLIVSVAVVVLALMIVFFLAASSYLDKPVM